MHTNLQHPATSLQSQSTEIRLSFDKKRLLINTQILGPKFSKYKPFFIDTPTEMGSQHPFSHKNLKFQWTIYSWRECNGFYNKNSVYVIFKLHLRRLSGWCLI